MKFKNLSLLISLIIVIPAAFVYGFNILQLRTFLFDFQPNSIDFHSMLKANMGIYLGFSALWILGINLNKFWNIAIITNAIFMCGLGLGRLISIALDGLPSIAYTTGMFGELLLGLLSIMLYNKYNNPELD